MKPLPRPFLKWAGGKSRLLPALARRLPERIGVYHEPFLGGGALFFHLVASGRIRRAFLSDINRSLVDTYAGVRDGVDAVIAHLRDHEQRHGKDHYYRVRDEAPDEAPVAARAARLIYLNRTCYNGLYRESRSGRFNVPMGRYRKPTICDEPLLRAVARALQSVELACSPFQEVLQRARPDDLVYMDPPYQPVAAGTSFTAYHHSGFGEPEQRRLADVFRRLAASGVNVVLSNSDTGLVQDMYDGLSREQVQMPRSINSKGSGRGAVDELIIRAGPSVS